MKETMKKIIAVLIALGVFMTPVNWPDFTVKAEANSSDVYEVLMSFKDAHNNKYWNHLVTANSNNADELKNNRDYSYADSFTTHPCYAHDKTAVAGQYDCNWFDGMQCWGYASYLFYCVFGYHVNASESNARTDYANLSIGDWVRLGTWGNSGHSGIILSISGNTFTMAECNVDSLCAVKWGTISRQKSSVIGFIHASNYDSIKATPKLTNITTLNKFYMINSDDVPVHATPSSSGTVQSLKLKKGSIVYFTEKGLNSENNCWYHVGDVYPDGEGRYQGDVHGYVLGSYLSEVPTGTYIIHEDMGVDLSLRSSTSKTSTKLTTVPRGVSFSVTNISGGWGYTTYDGKTGWLMLGYCRYIGHAHSYSNSWISNSTNHWHECSCGAKSGTAAHSFGAWTVTKPATIISTGSKTRSCSVCGYKDTQITDIIKGPYEFVRSKGETRYETALATANNLKEVLKVEKFDTIIIACASNFPDALSGSYLAADRKAPILLVGNEVNSDGTITGLNKVLDFVKKNLVTKGHIFILGGNASVPNKAENELKAITPNVVRLFGETRYETNIAILEEVGFPDGTPLLIADSSKFADALSASALGLPLLLVNKTSKELTRDQKNFLNGKEISRIYILGGETAVPNEFVNQLKDYVAGKNITRINGPTRFETSIAVANEFFTGAKIITVASGAKFPDGLTGGPLANALGVPLVLSLDGNEAPAKEYFKAKNCENIVVFGGENSISDTAIEKIFDRY